MFVWKYPLDVVGHQYVEMPESAQIVSVAEQRGVLCLWALVYPQEDTRLREIEIIGTGNPVEPHRRQFIGTVQMGSLVWHVFERFMP